MCCTRLAGNAGTKKSPKICHLGTIARLCWAISLQLRHLSTIGKKTNSNVSPTCPYNMVNFGPLVAEIVSLVWGTPANVNGFRVLAALLHGTLVVGVSQTLRRWTEGATYIREGGHDVGHWPTFLVIVKFHHYETGSFHYYIMVLSVSVPYVHTIYIFGEKITILTTYSLTDFFVFQFSELFISATKKVYFCIISFLSTRRQHPQIARL